MSYSNVVLYNSVLPSYDDKTEKFNNNKDANVPGNFKEEVVRK